MPVTPLASPMDAASSKTSASSKSTTTTTAGAAAPPLRASVDSPARAAKDRGRDASQATPRTHGRLDVVGARLAELGRRIGREGRDLVIPCGALGFAAGLRTTAPMLALAGQPGLGEAGGLGRVIAGTLGATELVATKVPFLSRGIGRVGVFFRVAAGAAAGAYVAHELARSPFVGALTGGLAAGAGLAAAVGVRAATVGRVPRGAVALVQDTAALALARFGAQQLVTART